MSREEEATLVEGEIASVENENYATDPFQLIERGNAYEVSGNYWSAAGCFGRAHLVLKSEGDRIFDSISEGIRSKKKRIGIESSVEQVLAEGRKLSEQEKIGNLYHEQSLEYLYRARDSLIQALRLENEDDQNRQKQTSELKLIENRRCSELDGSMKMQLPHEVFQPLLQLISPVEAVRRTRIFQQIYSCMEQPEKVQQPSLPQLPVAGIPSSNMVDAEPQSSVAVPINITTNEIGTQTVEIIQVNETQAQSSEEQITQIENVAELSLEERLARLESTLPPRPKTGKQRERDIRNGLDKLGVYIPNSTPIPEAVPLSEDQEVQNIIAQATDEVNFYNQAQNKENNVQSILRNSAIRIDVSEFTDFDYEEENDHEDDVHDLLNRAGKLQNEAQKTITEETNIDMQQKDSIEKVVESAKKQNSSSCSVMEEDEENKQVQELIESAKILSEAETIDSRDKPSVSVANGLMKDNANEDKDLISSVLEKEEENKQVQNIIESAKILSEAEICVGEDKPSGTVTNEMLKDNSDGVEIDDREIENRNFVEKVEKLQVEADNLINEVKNSDVPEAPKNKPIDNEELNKNKMTDKKKTEPQSKSDVMENNLKLLSDTHEFIDKASNYLEDIIIENEEQIDSDSENEGNHQKSIKKFAEMHEKGKASVSEAIKCLQKVLDTWS